MMMMMMMMMSEFKFGSAQSFCGGEKIGEIMILGARTRTNNKLDPHTAPGPGNEPRPHWWETSALTTAPSLLPYSKGGCILWNVNYKYIYFERGCRWKKHATVPNALYAPDPEAVNPSTSALFKHSKKYVHGVSWRFLGFFRNVGVKEPRN